MEFQSSRFAARTDADGAADPARGPEPDASGTGHRSAAGSPPWSAPRTTLQRKGTGWGPYALQAALAECHAVAPTAADTDWARIVSLYDGLLQIAPSPVVELNRAVAVAMADPGPPAALRDRRRDRPASTAPTCCRACAANCWPGSAATPRPPTSSTAAAALADNERERDVLQDKATRARERLGARNTVARGHRQRRRRCRTPR